MIQIDGKKATPKEFANELLVDSVAVTRGYWQEKTYLGINKMTEKEIDAIHDQLKKQSDRIAVKLGYKKSWIA